MRTMPSVTLTTVPTLRASVADLNLSMRALMRSLISDALMDITLNPLANTGRLRRQLEPDAFEPALESLGERLLLRAVDRRSGRHRHVDDAFRLVLVLIEQRGNFGQEP